MAPRGTTGRFARSDRLLDSRDFRRVLRRGRRRAHRDLLVVTAPTFVPPQSDGSIGNDLDPRNHRPDPSASRRLGITASRKVGGAVVRNRFKRRVREWFRTRRSELPPGTDLVVIARRSGAQLSLAELDARLSGLLDLAPGGPAAGDPSSSGGATTQGEHR